MPDQEEKKKNVTLGCDIKEIASPSCMSVC